MRASEWQMRSVSKNQKLVCDAWHETWSHMAHREWIHWWHSSYISCGGGGRSHSSAMNVAHTDTQTHSYLFGYAHACAFGHSVAAHVCRMHNIIRERLINFYSCLIGSTFNLITIHFGKQTHTNTRAHSGMCWLFTMNFVLTFHPSHTNDSYQ